MPRVSPRFNRFPGGVLGGTGCELLRTFLDPCALDARVESVVRFWVRKLLGSAEGGLAKVDLGFSELARICCRVCRGMGRREEVRLDEVGCDSGIDEDCRAATSIE